MYLIAIKKEDVRILNDLDKINKNEENNNKKFDIINSIYQRGLLNQEIIKKLIMLENNNYKIEISIVMFSLIKNKDDKLIKIIYNNFIFNNSFIKRFLYQYKNYKSNKKINVLSNSEINYTIVKEINKIYLNIKNNFIDLLIRSGNENFMKFLIEKGVDINKKDIYGKAPLIVAIKCNNESIVKFLVENGADINKENKEGETPLITAIENNNESIVKILIENGADVNKEILFCNDIPLIVAFQNNNESIVKYLIENGADVDKKRLLC